MAKSYRIFPGVGIARIGNSSKYFIGPESPYVSSDGPFKERGRIKKQAARFRVYEFEIDESGRETLVGEVLDSQDTSIEWHVHLANKKAASRTVPNVELDVNGNERLRNPGYDQSKLTIEAHDAIKGPSVQNAMMAGEIIFLNTRRNVVEGRDTVKLGHLETDSQGRLLVIGGDGVSKSPISRRMNDFANNPGWYDDCCDGPVNATLTINGQSVEVEGAWVVVCSPAYAPDIMNVVTWYDQARSVDASSRNPMAFIEAPSFTHDIYPILKRASQLQWVSQTADAGHGRNRAGDFLDSKKLSVLSSTDRANQSERSRILSRLMPPNTPAPGPQRLPPNSQNMPMLYSGVDPQDLTKCQYASLTPLQYSHMQKWANGDFIEDWQGEPPGIQFDDIPLAEQPQALDKAALQACIGGPFFPGIESTYLMALPSTYIDSYRIDPAFGAGYMTQFMALPWQADYIACGKLWWPAQRPVSVETGNGRADFDRGIKDYADMRDHWSKLGFIVRDGDEYIEKERGSI